MKTVISMMCLMLLLLVFNGQKQLTTQETQTQGTLVEPINNFSISRRSNQNQETQPIENEPWFSSKQEVLDLILSMNERQDPLLINPENIRAWSGQTLSETSNPVVFFNQLKRHHRIRK